MTAQSVVDMPAPTMRERTVTGAPGVLMLAVLIVVALVALIALITGIGRGGVGVPLWVEP